MTTMLGLSLEGRPVLLVGGGSVTTRRARRLLDEGAHVRVIAPAVDDELRALIEQHGIPWRRRRVRRSDVSRVWLVHTATGDRRIDARIAALCEQRRILCVNAGDGSHGTAKLAAETRSGDVIVGVVSDAGVDPARSGALRTAIATALAEGRLPLRRRRPTAVGQVHLVGGGPGPVDLITVRGRRLLAEADVVITDRLGPVGVLDELDPEVEVIDVGKRPGNHTVPQEGINDLIVQRALQGKRVVRLKGGDPFVFGRGGEEVQACVRAGVPVEVVPGLTSVVSVPQAAGIPVTHRGTAAAMHVVNGQDAMTAATVAALKDDATTTVVLMGVSALQRFAREAMSAGVPGDRPAAIIEQGHTDKQRTTRSSLAGIADEAERVGVANPAVIVVGDVARAGLLLGPPQPAAAAQSAGFNA